MVFSFFLYNPSKSPFEKGRLKPSFLKGGFGRIIFKGALPSNIETIHLF